jgi:hypothetical protein
MVPVIHTWEANPLAELHKRLPKEAQNELTATYRRVFAQAIIVQLYGAPFHCFYEQDHDGQWADDGGRIADR